MHKSLWAGGIEAMVCGLASEMSKTEDVTVCTIMVSGKGDVFYDRMSDKVKVESIGKHDDKTPIKEIFKIVRYIRNGHFDVVHIHGYFYYYVLAIFLLHRKTHFFFTAHNDALMENTPWDLRLLPIKKKFMKLGWLNAVTISPASRDSFEKLYHCPNRMIPNGISRPVIDLENELLSRYKKTPDTKVFVNPGRICPQKNQAMLCRVFSRLIEEGEDIALVMVGPNHWQQIYDEIQRHASDRIAYLGEYPDVPSLLNKADGMCLSSIYEGLPVVLLEALAVGCIPVCTPVGGIVNVIENNQNGILSASPSEEEYYDAVKAYLRLPSDVISCMKKKCLETFGKYDISITAADYLKYYRDTI